MAMAREEHLLSTEIVNRGISDEGSQTFSVRVRRRLPDFLQSVNLKYVKLGYHYLITHGLYLAILPVLVLVFSAEVGSLSREELWRKVWDSTTRYDLATVLSFVALFVFTLSLYIMSKPRPTYLLDFACYKPSDDLKVTKEQFIELARNSGKYDESSLEFKKRILESSGIGDETYVPKSIGSSGNTATMKEGRAEASTVMFGALDELFEKTKIRPKDVGILVVNCSIFNPTPSLSAMIINHYKMRGNILSFNLGGMGCSAGIIALDLARDMLQANPNNYAIVVSGEMVGFNWYQGKERSMLIPNCFFRMGCSALLLSNRRRDYHRAKYSLEHIVRTHKASNDRAFRSIYQEEDSQGYKGLRISKDLVEVGGDALKTNITTLGPLVLPLSEQLFFFGSLVWRHLFGNKNVKGNNNNNSQLANNMKPYIPDYKLAFEHFCVYAASKTVLDELQRNLELSEENMEASHATLHRFGNTSSSSIWYELAYLEAKEKIQRGDRVWQIAFGSGFKCNSDMGFPANGSSPEKPLKFLIYGRTGWIGGLLGVLCKAQGIEYAYGSGRLENRSSLETDLATFKPSHVFNAAGVTGRPNVDWCESHKVETIRVNVVGTLTLADVCREKGLILINYATGCIFEYDAAHPLGSGIGFKEEDTPNFTGSFYSKTKAMVEELLKNYDNVCTLRVRMPISSDLTNPRNFITKITRYDKVVDIPNSMTILDELLPISIEMAKRNLTGIWNFTNPGVVSHNEILEMYRDYIDPSFKWKNFTLKEQAEVIVAPRSNNELDASKLSKEFPEMKSIKESLIENVFKPNRKTPVA